MKELKIVKIEKLEEKFELYDIETENHNFFANDILVHNSNAGICFSEADGMWAQSRENIISVEKDNAGFAFFVSQNEEALKLIINELAEENRIDLNEYIISLYGEWAGGNIQKNSAMSGLDKAFVIFEHFKVSPIEPSEDEKAVWLKTGILADPFSAYDVRNWVKSTENKIYNVMDFPTYSFTIDFNAPERSVNEIIKLVEEVIEPASPLGKAFGQEANIGEGIVCSHLTADGALIQFKCKGEAHSAKSKVTTLKPVDTAKLDKIDACVKEITHNWRYEQGLVTVFGSDYEQTIDRKKMGDYLKWVAADTLKEELDLISQFGFEPKDVMGKVQAEAKRYFQEVEALK